jgi:hypothetical protein
VPTCHQPLAVVSDPQAPVPVIIFGGFCNWLEFNGVLGFWDVMTNCLPTMGVRTVNDFDKLDRMIRRGIDTANQWSANV